MMSNVNVGDKSKNGVNIIAALVIVVTCGAFFFIDVPGGLTVRLIDVVELAMAAVVMKNCLVAPKVRTGLFPPWLFLVYCFFFALLILCPVLGIVVYDFEMGLMASSFRFMSFALLVWFCFQLKIDGRQASRGLQRALVIAVIANFIYAVLQKMEFRGIIPWGALPHHYVTLWYQGAKFADWGRTNGLFLNPNKLGWLGVTSYCVFFVGCLHGHRWHKLLAMISILLALLSNSRSAIFTILGVTTVIIFVLAAEMVARGKSKKIVAVRIVEFILLLTAGGYAIWQWSAALFKIKRVMRFVRVASEGTQVDTSLTGRIQGHWQNGLNAVQLYPWGTGVDPVACVGVIDSGWLSYWVQGGVVLFLAFATYLLSVGGYGLACYIKANDGYGLSLFALAVAIVVGSVVLSPFHHLPVFVVFHILLYVVMMNRKEQTVYQTGWQSAKGCYL